MEALMFALAFLISVFQTANRSQSSPALFLCFVIFSTIFSVVIRTSGYDYDINVYARAMVSDLTTFDYAREPIVWFGLRFLYWLFDSELVAFFVMDIICFSLLYRIFSSMRLPVYAYFLMFYYIPFVVGFENILRQYVASIFLLYAIFSFGKSRYLYYVGALLSHNVALIFAPLVIGARLKINLNSVIVLLLIFVGLTYFGGVKAQIETGLNFALAFVVLIIILAVFVFKLFSRDSRDSRNFRDVALLSVLLICPVFIILSTGQVERFGYLILGVMFPIVVLTVEKLKPVTIARLTFCICSALLLIIFNLGSDFIVLE
tara:strand:+ start:12139 stop:13092 length:954 start_codon:yes stop_codon:yes gene_type:complete